MLFYGILKSPLLLLHTEEEYAIRTSNV